MLDHPDQVVLRRRGHRGRTETPRGAIHLLQLGIGGDADPAIQGGAGTDQTECFFLGRAHLQLAAERGGRRQCARAGRGLVDEGLSYLRVADGNNVVLLIQAKIRIQQRAVIREIAVADFDIDRCAVGESRIK